VPKTSLAAPDPEDRPRDPYAGGVKISKLPAQTSAVVQLCLRAADLRAQHRTFAQIAVELELGSPADAQRAVRQGLALTPADDVREVRRLEDMRLAEIAVVNRETMLNPPPLAQLGKVVHDENGNPVPDEQARAKAAEVLLKVSAEMRKLHGADAPKKTLAITHEMVAERIVELKRELGINEELMPGFALPPGLDGGGSDD
jgi:hypothetical protein